MNNLVDPLKNQADVIHRLTGFQSFEIFQDASFTTPV